MNIFRRPMFRGGPVDSRGTGITSGLSYGGRVGLQGGGMPPTGNPRFINLGGGQGPTTIGGRQIYQRPIGPPTGGLRIPKGFRNARGLPTLRMLGLSSARAMGIPTMSTAGILAAPFLPTAAMAAMNMPKTDAALQFMKDAPDFTFDETNIDVGDFYDELSRKNKEGTPISTLDAFFLDPETGTYPKFMGRLEDREKRAAIEKAKIGKQTENPLDDGEGKALSAAQIENIELKKLLEGFMKAEPKAKESDMEESVEIDKEKFAKILGKDKARGQDFADMLLSYAGKALKDDATVRSSFSEFFEEEAKRPSRARKIDDSAAALAINKYIKGEISKQEAEAFLNRAKVQSDLIADRGKLTAGQAFAKSTSPTFAGRVKDAALTVFETSPKFEVVESKDMIPVEEGGKFDFSQEDVGVIFIETDTRESYTFDSNQRKIPFING